MFLIFDTETTGLPKKWKAPITDIDNWPRCIQIAWQLHDQYGELLEHSDFLIHPEGFNIPYDAEQIHGISTQLASEKGEDLQIVLQKFNEALEKSSFVVGQNVKFDLNIMGCEFHRLGIPTQLNESPVLDTCTETTATLCQLPGGRGGKFKLPTLTELHEYLFNVPFSEAHNATADVEATTRCFFELIRKKVFSLKELGFDSDYFQNFDRKNAGTIQVIGLKHLNLKKESAKLKTSPQPTPRVPADSGQAETLENANFAHLHCHSQFSVLQSTTSISDLVKATIGHKMPAVALTDLGNMMGAFYFIKEVLSHNKAVAKFNAEKSDEEEEKTEIKPILGCEFYVCENHEDRTHKDNGYQVVFLAKNKKGYHNLAKMSSISHTKGFYYVPRIDKKIIEEYKDDLIVLSGSLQGEIPNKLLNQGEKQAEEALLWWKEQFGDDFYLELMRHDQENENHVSPARLQPFRQEQYVFLQTIPA